MVANRSVPATTVLPHITYRNVADASDWLTAMFGFTEQYRYGPPGAPSGAQMYLGDTWVMLDTAGVGEKTPAELGYGTQSLTVFVADCRRPLPESEVGRRPDRQRPSREPIR